MTVELRTKNEARLDLTRALAWKHPALVRRYCADLSKAREEGERCFTAFKQFLAVCALADGERVPSRNIDDMWHTALLFSRSYQQFCTEVLTEIVHHEPVETPPDVAAYAAAREDALELFGELDDEYWPDPASVRLCGSKYPGKDCPPWPLFDEPL